LGDVTYPQTNQITAAQLTVNAEVEKGEIARSTG
jgi:hypothetical protein